MDGSEVVRRREGNWMLVDSERELAVVGHHRVSWRVLVPNADPWFTDLPIDANHLAAMDVTETYLGLSAEQRMKLRPVQ
jgi:hypothetical protein